jgi:hypothetical protein
MYQCVKLLTSERGEILKQIQNIADLISNAMRLVAGITSFKNTLCVIFGAPKFNPFTRFRAQSLQISYTSLSGFAPILEE